MPAVSLTPKKKPDAITIEVFAQRLIRIFRGNQQGEPCTCGTRSEIGHRFGCPQHPWEVAILQIELEMQDSIAALP